jgi:F-type H+-transporting ATPase subunit c
MLKRYGSLLVYGALAFFAHPLTLLAQEASAGHADGGNYKLGLALAAGLGIVIAALGGALGQGKAASAALEGIARNPEAGGKLFVPMILCLVFIESLVLFTFAICFILQGKI